VIVFAGGIIPDEDVDALKAAGIAAVFGPGTNTDHVVEFIRAQFETA
jgi:methylmalonyl-CoA mutase C-terminal domain/subunit